ncbi:MAG TPA: Uma2 family endonuclease [Oceanobacillus sp.]|nr:Uma2 family endonuclease [Oceanobacillus sp.]
MVAKLGLHTVDEFEQFINKPENADRRFELIYGEIVEKVPTEEHGAIVVNICTGLKIHAKAQNPEDRVTVESRHSVSGDNINDRLPDIAYTTAARAMPITRKGAVPQMPDLAVEVKSPNDSYTQIRSKALFYLANGTRLVWLVFPERRVVEVYHENGDLEVLTERDDDVLDGGDVLPGFRMPLRDVFAV